MNINTYNVPKTSFLSVEKDMAIIIQKLLTNNRLKKLLFYKTKDALLQENLTQDETLGLINKEIKTIPKIRLDNESLIYIIINFDNFTPSGNPEFRDNDIVIDIVCHIDHWQLNDYQLRPYKIAGELDYMLDGQKLTGIGTVNFIGASQQTIDSDYAVVTMLYHVVHGGEDSYDMVNPVEEKQFIEEFNKLYNN